MAAYFNNPPQPTTSHPPDSHVFPTNDAAPSTSSLDKGDNSHVPRPKRIACVVCRRRKLRCDGKRPSCGTCSRLGHECAYDEVRRKSGPKRGYVKQLEARLGMGCQTTSLQPERLTFFSRSPGRESTENRRPAHRSNVSTAISGE
jgi:hypothetical protein